MLSLSPLTLSALPALRPFFAKASGRICDDTLGGVFLWRELYHTEYAVQDDTLFLRSHGQETEGGVFWCSPMGGDPILAIETLRRQQPSQPLQLGFVSEEELALLQSVCPALQAREIPDAEDYLYNAADLQTLEGHSYAGQRNHIRQFIRANPDWRFEPITRQNLPAVQALLSRYAALRQKDALTFQEDERRALEVLQDYADYGFVGGAVFSEEDKAVSMALGEVRGDTLYVHIEKADPLCHGAYQMIVQQFSQYAAGEGVCFINREDDAGDPGLRKSKLSYKPCRMLKKYLVELPAEDAV